MAYTTTTANLGLFDRLRALIADFRNVAKEQAAYNQTYKELSRLTNRELADIGLRRCDIVAACSGTIAR